MNLYSINAQPELPEFCDESQTFSPVLSTYILFPFPFYT